MTQFMPVKKIAVFNPYLQGGHVKTAEIESTQRFINAAKKRNIDVKMFDETSAINNFEPDFVFSISHQIPKLTQFPSYINVNIPVSMIANVNRFVENILSYDAYVCVSPSVLNWLDQISKRVNKTSIHCEGYFSLEKTAYQRPNFENAFAMYMGTNWDGSRHGKVFNLFDDGQYLKCFGPKHSWDKYSSQLYGGEVPFDGISVLDYYRTAGAGLCIGHPAFDSEGIANNRLYEIAASSALLIASDNTFTKSKYADTALYFNQNADSQSVYEQIKAHVCWIRENPADAEAMSRASHERFNNELSNDYYLSEMLNMHQKVLEQKYRVTEKHNITYFIAKPIIDSSIIDTIETIKAQAGESSIILVSENTPSQSVLNSVDKRLVTWVQATAQESTQSVMNKLNIGNQSNWINVLSPGDLLYQNHEAIITNTLNELSSSSPGILKTEKLIASSKDRLIEKQYDEHYFKVNNLTCYDRENLTASMSNIVFSHAQFLTLLGEKPVYHLNAEKVDLSSAYSIVEVTCQVQAGQWAQAKISDNMNKMNELSAELLKKQNELSAIYHSKTWKLANKIKSIYQKLRFIVRFGRFSHES